MSDPLIGYEVDGLRFERLLGRGAMGAVYQGLQLRLQRPVAIKVIAPHLAGDRAAIDRFGREARTLVPAGGVMATLLARTTRGSLDRLETAVENQRSLAPATDEGE